MSNVIRSSSAGGGSSSISFGGIVNGFVAKDLVIPAANTFVDMDMVTTLDPNSAADWIQTSDGKMQYTGSRSFMALMDFNTSAELVSAATNGLNINIMRNGSIIKSLGGCEITATQAYPNMTFIVSVIPSVIFHAEVANTTGGIDIRQRTMYMRVSEV